MTHSPFDALSNLELDEFKKYCQEISVEGAIAQTVTLTLGRGQGLWCSKGSLLGYSDGVDWTLKARRREQGRGEGPLWRRRDVDAGHLSPHKGTRYLERKPARKVGHLGSEARPNRLHKRLLPRRAR